MKYNLRLHFQTQRLIIRPLEKNDYHSWYNGYSNSKLAQYKYDKGQLDLLEKTESWFYTLVRNQQEAIKEDDIYYFAIFDKRGQHIGMIDLKTLSRDNFQWAELGYFIHNQFWRRGYAYEALVEIVTQAQQILHFHRIEAHVNLDNEPSQKLLEKVGFHFECIRKGFIFENGQWTDHFVYYLNTHNNDISS